MDAPKSSFVKRIVTKEDAIIQFLRPQLNAKVGQVLDLFERLVDEAETLTTLGVKVQTGGERYYATPDDLRANLDEFGELEQIAAKGRALLKDLGYVTRRKSVPIVGSAPVGQTVQIQPISTQLPGEEPLQGAVVSTKTEGGK